MCLFFSSGGHRLLLGLHGTPEVRRAQTDQGLTSTSPFLETKKVHDQKIGCDHVNTGRVVVVLVRIVYSVLSVLFCCPLSRRPRAGGWWPTICSLPSYTVAGLPPLPSESLAGKNVAAVMFFERQQKKKFIRLCMRPRQSSTLAEVEGWTGGRPAFQLISTCRGKESRKRAVKKQPRKTSY